MLLNYAVIVREKGGNEDVMRATSPFMVAFQGILIGEDVLGNNGRVVQGARLVADFPKPTQADIDWVNKNIDRI